MEIKHKISPQNLSGTFLKQGQYINILNSLPAMIAYVDTNLRYQYVNTSYEKFHGKKKDEIIGRSVLEVVGEAVYEQIKKNIVTALNGRVVNIEREMFFSGVSHFMEVTLTPDFDRYGEVKGYTVFANDITAKKRTEKQLEQKNSELNDYLNNATTSLHGVDADGIIKWANQAELNMLGYTEEEYIGHHISEFHADKKAINDILQRLSKNEQLNSYESVLRCKDGTLRNVLINSNVLWQDGKFIHTRCFTLDITEQQQLFKKLYESEYRYRELIEKLPVAVYTCDAEGRIEIYNKAAEDLWGRKPEVGKDMWCGSWRIYQPDGAPLPLDGCPMAVTLKEGRPVYGEEIVVERPDGTRLNVAPYPQPILDSSGAVVGAVNMLIDITDRKKAEEVNAKLAAIVQSSDDAIISKTLNGIVTSWNNAAMRMFGYSADEMIGEPITKLIPTERLDEEPQILERLKKGERVDHFETERITKDGRKLNISLTISPVKDSKGRIIGASKIARDITEQKKIFEALRESEERFRTVADTAPVMIWMTGTDKLCNFINEAWLEFTGSTRDKETGYGWLKHIHPDDLDKTFETYKNSFKERKEFRMEYRVKRFDGEYRWVFGCGIPRFSPYGSFLGYIGTSTDIQERKTASKELEKLVAERTAALQMANLHLEKSNQELERFAYVASHDLQEPLRKIQAFGDLILERNGNEFSVTGKDYLARMIKSANRMQGLIEALLEFSRATTPQKNFEKKDLTILAIEVKKELQETIEEKNAKVNMSPLPAIPVIPFQFKQMLSNIMGNALKYTKSNEIPVINIGSQIVQGKDINKKGARPDIDYCKLTIQDNGIGFDKENDERIFELFQRLHGRHEYGGSGIGLSICKKIAENHGGFITAEGEKGKGASFHIYLPMQQK